MPKRCIRSLALSALACWLTLLASADDFNLARLALGPSTPDSEGLLPLDDPNSDFTESSQSPGPPTPCRTRWGCTSSVGRCGADVDLTSSFAALAYEHPPRLHLNTPLHC
jgi:hypothetical protein